MFKNLQKRYFFCENKRNNILKYTFFPLIILVLGSFLLANTAWLSSITEEKIIELTNQERGRFGITGLTANQLLAQAAYKKGQAILAAQKFQHNIDGVKFSSWIKDAGYQYNYVGENLAIDFITSEGVIKAWLKSPTHRKNLLNSRFSEIGVSVINGKFDGNDTILVVQIFGEPKFMPNENIAINNASGNVNNELALIPQNEYIDSFAGAKPTLLNTGNSTDEFFESPAKNYLAQSGIDNKNKTYSINNFLGFMSDERENLSGIIAAARFNYLWLLTILFLIFYSLYLYNNNLIYKIKFLFKKQKTQLRLPLK